MRMYCLRYIRVVLLLGMIFIIAGGAMTAAQEPVVDRDNSNDRDRAQLFGDTGIPFYHVPQQNDEGIRPAAVPATCTRIGFDRSWEGWTVHAGNWYTGTGYIYTKGMEGGLASVSYNLNLTRTDFQAHMWRKGCSDCANGIIIRGNPDSLWDSYFWDTMYMFAYTNEGGCLVGKSFYYHGIRVYQILFNGSCLSSIHTGEEWNTLRAVADGDQLSFYINDELVWSGQDQSLSYGRVGIAMEGNFFGGPTNEEFRVAWASLCWPYAAFLPLVTR